MELVPLALAAPILLWIAWTDFRSMRIRNTAVLAAVAVFVVTARTKPIPEHNRAHAGRALSDVLFSGALAGSAGSA